MTTEVKERTAFLAASLIELADMTESDLQSVIDIVGVDAVRELMCMDHLCSEIGYENMAEEICDYIGWNPMLVIPWRTDADLSQTGHQIADLVENADPSGEDAAETLFSVMAWEGLGAWLEVNKG